MVFPFSSHQGSSDTFGPVPSWLAILVLVVDLIIIVWILRSRKPLLTKLAWIAVIVFLHVLGWIIYFFLGREKR